MPQSTLNTRHPREWELALRREMLTAIGLQFRTECELPNELRPEPTSKAAKAAQSTRRVEERLWS